MRGRRGADVTSMQGWNKAFGIWSAWMETETVPMAAAGEA